MPAWCLASPFSALSLTRTLIPAPLPAARSARGTCGKQVLENTYIMKPQEHEK